MAILFNARTDVGRLREQNEDNFLVDRKLQLYMVCDGMGGHASGEVASATAVNVVREHLVAHRQVLEAYRTGDASADALAIINLLDEAVLTASKRIWERGQLNPEQRGMGTTCSVMLILGRRGFIAHVGDSRVYRLRDGEVMAITEDHSLYYAMLKAGTIPDENDPRMSHIRNAVTRAVGVQDDVVVDAFDIELEPGDRYLLCSDGLHGYWEGPDVGPMDFMSEGDLAIAVDGMIDFANDQGGKDNITAILLELPPEESFEETMGGTRNDDLLRRATFAKGLNTRERRVLANRLTERELEPGGVLVADGTPADGLWIVADGELEVRSKSGSRRALRPGDLIGETALLAGAPHALRIEASKRGPARLLFLSRQEIRRLTTEDPGLLARIMTNIAVRQSGRLVAATQALEDPIWRYGFPESRPRSGAAARPKSVTTAELDVICREDLEAAQADMSHVAALVGGEERPAIDGGGDTLPNIPLASASRPLTADLDFSGSSGEAALTDGAYKEAMADLVGEQNEDAMATTEDFPTATDVEPE
jgi:serine/threonine protein phosphatase PrpC/CRP-like cAMP-binding protein